MTYLRVPSRRSVAKVTFPVILVAGWAAVAVSVPVFLRRAPGAPPEFWVLVLIALLSELAPLAIPHERKQSTQLAVSLSLTFGMLLLWGPAVAIVAQALALGVAQVRARRSLNDFALDTARFSLAFLAAAWVYDRIDHAPATVGMMITESGLWVFLVAALGWFLADIGLIMLMLAVSGPAVWRLWAGPPLYYYMAASAGLLTFAPVLITAQTGWLLVFIAIPLALFGLFSRILLKYQRSLDRDPVTQQHSTQGLHGAVERNLVWESLSFIDRHLGYLEIRIDGLDEVTNVFGQQITDDVVKQIGTRIAEATSGESAVVGRVAATEFAVVLPQVDAAHSEHVANRLAQALMVPIEVVGVVFSVRPTIGVAAAPADGSDFDALTARAETAIMDARQDGALVRVVRNRDELEARRRLELLVDLRAAIENSEHAGELFVHYQPQVRISDGRLVGVEALARWQHPDRGLVDTADMITTAEASGVISLLTLRIIDDVLAQLAAWSTVGLRLRASVNVSAKDLASPQFADHVKHRLARHSIAPEHLQLEVTETALVVSTTADRTIADLAAMGVDLSLDDFGTGYTSIQQLRRYPLRELKIDRSYIATMATSHADHAVITSITQLATDLGLRVVAEGVEDAATSTALGRIGPLIGQGWHYGRPMTAADLITWIDARTTTRP